MIVGLLILIVLILLFGAGVVKGWLKNALGLVLGLLIAAGALTWLAATLGEDGAMIALLVGGAVLIGLGIWVKTRLPPPPARGRGRS